MIYGLERREFAGVVYANFFQSKHKNATCGRRVNSLTMLLLFLKEELSYIYV